MPEGIKHLTKETFEQEVQKTNQKPLIVDFFADWCGPCKMLAPIMEQIAHEYGDKLTVAKVNVDEQKELAEQFGVMSIPTLISFTDGKMAEKSVGVKTKDAILQMANIR